MGQPSGSPVQITSNTITVNVASENMSDQLSVKLDGESRAKQRRREASLSRQLRKLEKLEGGITPFRLGKKFSDVHRCTHTKTAISFDDTVYKARRIISGDKYRIYTYVHRTGSFLTRNNILGPDLLNSGRWNSRQYTSEVYRTPDWFALLDSFHEATNSLIPSSTLVGESIVENAIFIDAFKILLNPSYSLKLVLKNLSKVYKRGMTLGGLRRNLKNGANAYLGYQFGVKPAIQEIRRALSAHEIVQGRLNWLSRNAGNFVPVRVRSKIDSPFVNEALPSNGNLSTALLCDSKSVQATISCWCKVREDLNYADQWSAYVQYFGLQKVVGLAWELVPMSFVIDWFTNAQEYINRYTSPPVVNPFYNMRGLSHSLKQQLVESLWVGSGYYYSEEQAKIENPSSAFKVCSRTTSSYTRTPSLPATSGFVDFSNLGLFHLSTLGVMLLQKKL
jgi:hypothetical protein